MELPIVTDVEFSFYLHLEVADRPGVLAQVAEILGLQGVSIRSVVQKGLGDEARLVMVMHPVLESKFRAAVELIVAARLRARAAARDPRDRGDLLSLWRYRDRLPVDPLVTMGEGDTPLIPAPRLSELTGADVWLKLEGANPTGSFKDRGMTVAVSAAIAEGAEAVICASTGNTAASAAAYAARAGLRGAVIVPEGKIATGKLAQALMHGARVIALRGNFDEALALVRELAQAAPDRARQLGQRLPHRGAEDRRLRGLRRARRGARRALHPGRQRRQRHLLVEGLPGVRGGAGAARLPGRGRRAAGARARRWRTRRRWRRRSGSATRRAGRTR